jgi:type I restriction enzyme, R subunit
MSPGITESVVEDATLLWLKGLGYDTLHAPDIAPNEPAAERASYQGQRALL